MAAASSSLLNAASWYAPAGNLPQQRCLDLHTKPGEQQVVQFSEDEWREQEGSRVSFQRLARGVVMSLVGIERGQKAAGVQNDHSPKPARASSTRSASVGSPLRNSGKIGRG